MTTENQVLVRVGGHRLSLTNLDKVLYPATGTTKAEVVDYYTRIADIMLPHVRSRPMTLRRWPDGTGKEPFFEKDAGRNAPRWARTVELETEGRSSWRDGSAAEGRTSRRERINYLLVDDLPTLVYTANLAALELHVPQWTVDSHGEPQPPDRIVFDLDPGAPADIVQCCQVAIALAEQIADDGLLAHPKTSGGKGLQLYVALAGSRPWEDVHGYAREVAERLARAHPDLIVSSMAKRLRHGKVLVDWSQNHRAKTTIAPYSLRGRPEPTVSTPVTWGEVEQTAKASPRGASKSPSKGSGQSVKPPPLTFLLEDVVARAEDHGDLMSPLLTERYSLP